MKIGPQSQTLVSLTSLLDASRQQQQALREDQQEKRIDEEKARDARISARQSERQELIQQNRNALEKIQADLKERDLERLYEEYEPTEITSTDGSYNNEPININFRESIYGNSSVPGQPTFEKIGQIVDFKI